MPAPLSCNGVSVDTSPETFGSLQSASGLLGDPEAMRQRVQEEGYLYLPGLLDRDLILSIRKDVLTQLQAEGAIAPGTDLMDGIAAEGERGGFRPDLARGNQQIKQLLYEGPLMEVYRELLGGEVRHFDYTWFRAIAGRQATWPHCDIVYMGRGTRRLYTSWVPYGDTPVEVGGLMLLERSHRQAGRIHHYLERDVDTFCENKPTRKSEFPNSWLFDGVLSKKPDTLPEKFESRWLTTDYQLGDVLIFGMEMIHASLDNQTDRIRLSSDSRYQLAGEPADERWIGEEPPGHGPYVHRGVIC